MEENGVVWHPSVRFRDVQLADPLINELHLSYSLDSIAKRWGIPTKDDSLLKEAGDTWGLANVKKEMYKLPAHLVGDYAEYDALLPLLILEKQEQEIKAQELEEVWDLETDVLPVSLAMRRRGILIDQAQLNHISDWTEEVETSELSKVRKLTGVPVMFGDTNKSELLSRALLEIGLVCPLTPKTGKPSVKADFLRRHDHEVTRALLRAKQFAKLRTTFCKQVWENMTHGRVHCTFNQMRTQKPGQKDDEKAGAAYGRFSSTNFNIQNQPIRHKEYGKLWRSIYLPDNGTTWTCCDFSSQEPRLAVHLATVLDYPGAINTGLRYLEPYYERGEGDRFDEAKTLREKAKTLFLSYCYGKGKGKICKELGFPVFPASFISSRTGKKVEYLKPGPEGQAMLDRFAEKIPFIPMLAAEAQRRAEARGYVITLSGRRCRFRKFQGEYIELHKALNRAVQGGAGDQMKMALRDLHRAGLPIQLTVHDEVDWSATTKEEMIQAADIMRTAVTLNVPSKVDLEVGSNWGSLVQV
jgi:DNA polymerase I-like protein with 3'-5' exonuclease and polymerase domains